MGITSERAVQLLFRYRAMVLGYALTIVRDRYMAEDIFQEIVITVLRKHDSIVSEKSFPAWVRTATRFRALKVLRDKKRARVVPLDDDILEALEPHWKARENIEALNEMLDRCLEKLTDRARQLTIRRFQENESCIDIAKSERKPVHTIHVAFSRIYESLRRCMEPVTLRGRASNRP